MCPYCRVRHSLVPEGPHFAYTLPPEASANGGRPLFYVPYWRFRGLVFGLDRRRVTHRILDTSVHASSIQGLPYSLGLRPQAVALRFAAAEKGGVFLKAALDSKDFLNRLGTGILQTQRTSTGKLFYQAFIGETLNVIYAPVYLKGGTLYDAFTHDPVQRETDEEALRAVAEPRLPAEIVFQPATCPHCGWDLDGERDSVALGCRHCDSMWEITRRGFHRIAFSFFRSEKEKVDLHLPFWRLDVKAEGFALETFADFVRLTNLPRAVLPAMESQPFSFWVPAFKVHPKLFLRLGRTFTAAQRKTVPGKPLKPEQGYPTTLPAVEAFQSVPVILGALAPAKDELFPKIRRGRFAFREKELVFVPFRRHGSECLQPDLCFSVPRSALRWGREW